MAKRKITPTAGDKSLEASIVAAQENGELSYQGTIWFPDTVIHAVESTGADGSPVAKTVAILPGYYPQVQIDAYREIQERFPVLNNPERLEQQGFLLGVPEPPKMVVTDVSVSDTKEANLVLPTATVRQSQ